MQKIGIVGINGKMGKAVAAELENQYEIVGFSRDNPLDGDFELDLVIDFASAESSVTSAFWCKAKNVPLVVGATGQTKEQIEQIEKVSKSVPVFVAGNFSVGIELLKKALLCLVSQNTEDVVIFEKHHRLKKDAPSGTAKEIADLIKVKTNKMASVIFERGGEEVGTHTVDVYYGGEVISVSHRAFSRKVFAKGVKKAVLFMLFGQKTGLYKMCDLQF